MSLLRRLDALKRTKLTLLLAHTVSEVSPTAIRGTIVSSWQLVLAIGQVVGACVGQGTHTMTSTWAYRIPILVNLGLVAVIVGGMFIIPESPRWLVQKNRDEQAMAALRKINASQEDPELVAAAEMRSFTQARDEEIAMKGQSGWKTLFHGVERRKLICVVGILGSQQIGGVQVSTRRISLTYAQSRSC